ncbi:uncharacterized protein LOC115698495 [Cannabis sativa]|uniref:uncharacterized protein LOC115698495 n=1 Tax=Cannabis sativa TaxID=3483 RepID=UPI0011DF6453|nr:uncharacterized protein LOC115698495 [Cannabis sativa]
MIPLKVQPHHLSFFLSQNIPLPSFIYSVSHRPSRCHFKPNRHCFSHSPSPIPIPRSSNLTFNPPRVLKIEPLFFQNDDDKDKPSPQVDDLSSRGVVYQKTLALVECSMFAALTGLVYFLSNSLAIENYFGCFFSLPIVISSMRWGIPAGRKTMVATTMLLLVLSGPVKALTYLLKHGLVGLTMGALWRSGSDWKLSIFLCTIVRALGAVGYVLITSFIIRENILALITINIHASLTFLITAAGVYTVPSMNTIYIIFGVLVFLNSGSFVFLLHLLYSVFLTRLGLRASLRMPKWLEKAI